METKYRQAFTTIRARLFSHEISYDQAMAEADPILKEMNECAKGIARKYGRKLVPFTFTKVMRAEVYINETTRSD